MADEKAEKTEKSPAPKPPEPKDQPGSVDRLFLSVADYVSGKISNFVSFLFFLYTAGVVVGVLAMRYAPDYVAYVIIAPAIAGLISYYNRTIAAILFAGFLFWLFFLI